MESQGCKWVCELLLRSGLARNRQRNRLAGQGLALIALGRSAGFSPDDIRAVFLPSGAPRIDRQLLSARRDELDAMVKRLKAMSNGLRHAATCPAESHAQCPSFQRLLKAAAAGALERQTKREKPVGGLRRKAG